VVASLERWPALRARHVEATVDTSARPRPRQLDEVQRKLMRRLDLFTQTLRAMCLTAWQLSREEMLVEVRRICRLAETAAAMVLEEGRIAGSL
jgi:hypothetical protein